MATEPNELTRWPELQPFVSKIDMVTAAIRAKIFSGDLPAGTPLRQRNLAALLGVSVTPIREALRRLEAEGLVTYDVHIGATVVGIDSRPTEENFRIRAMLEGLAASMAAERVTDDDIDELENILRKMKECGTSDVGVLSALNRDFHFRIYSYARAPLLYSMILRLWQSFGGFPVLGRHLHESLAQHELIIAALKARSGSAAEEATRVHILTGMARADWEPAEPVQTDDGLRPA
jgi:DNA-binding GntR family transcriptional regulator